MTLIVKVIWLSVLVCGVTFIDISFGVYLVYKLKEEVFNWGRFLEGFLKMSTYIIVIGLGYLASEKIFNGSLFEIEHLVPKTITMVFVYLESSSIDRKRVRLGKKPFVELIRDAVKMVKELRKNYIEISKS